MFRVGGRCVCLELDGGAYVKSWRDGVVFDEIFLVLRDLRRC